MKNLQLTKSSLAIRLSKLRGFASPVLKSEQYCTDSETAAELIWTASLNGDIKGKTVLDLGCGTGILGIGSLILGSKKTVFLDKDEQALKILDDNLQSLGNENYQIVHNDLKDAEVKADTVIMNPPFGTKKKHADREFLLKAFESSKVVYSIHNGASLDFLSKISQDNGFRMTHSHSFDLPLKRSYDFHRKKIHRVRAVWARFISSP